MYMQHILSNYQQALLYRTQRLQYRAFSEMLVYNAIDLIKQVDPPIHYPRETITINPIFSTPQPIFADCSGMIVIERQEAGLQIKVKTLHRSERCFNISCSIAKNEASMYTISSWNTGEM